jgi:glutamate 5-kinase
MRTELKNAKKIVIKIGTSSLTYSNGNINLRKIEQIAKVLTDLKNTGREIILVSSGAVGAGMNRLGLEERPSKLKDKQAVAAVGQTILMQYYEKFFKEYNQTIAQLLLTKDVVLDNIKRTNVINTITRLLEIGVIPIANENDSVATDEIEMFRIGDNDTLSSMVATMIEADALLMLSDIDGLYDSCPNENSSASLIPYVNKVDENIHLMAGSTSSSIGTGGMVTKIKAAENLQKKGISMVIANGEDLDIIYDILEGKEVGTFFKGKLKGAKYDTA